MTIDARPMPSRQSGIVCRMPFVQRTDAIPTSAGVAAPATTAVQIRVVVSTFQLEFTELSLKRNERKKRSCNWNGPVGVRAIFHQLSTGRDSWFDGLV